MTAREINAHPTFLALAKAAAAVSEADVRAAVGDPGVATSVLLGLASIAMTLPSNWASIDRLTQVRAELQATGASLFNDLIAKIPPVITALEPTPAKPSLPTLTAKPGVSSLPAATTPATAPTAMPPKSVAAPTNGTATPPLPANQSLAARVAVPKMTQAAGPKAGPTGVQPVTTTPPAPVSDSGYQMADGASVPAAHGAGNGASSEIEAHEYAKLFPMASDDELQEMAADIKERGLREPILMLDGKVLDGRNRLKACALAEVEPVFRDYAGSDPLGDVISWNLKRRHLSTSQKSAIAVELKPFYEERAKERQEATRIKNGKTPVTASLREPGERHSREASSQAATAVGVSGRLVDDAGHVRKHDPALFEEVKAGRKTVTAAKTEIRQREGQNETAVADAGCPPALTVASKPVVPVSAVRETEPCKATGTDGLQFHLVFGDDGGICVVLNMHRGDGQFDPVAQLQKTVAGRCWHEEIKGFATSPLTGITDSLLRMSERVKADRTAVRNSLKQPAKDAVAAPAASGAPRLKIDADVPFTMESM